jgi:hypothetical protein
VTKSCGFCSFTTDDEALFADHVFIAHGWGQGGSGAAERRAFAAGSADDIYCYSCGTPNPRARAACSSCGGALRLAPSGRVFGRAYVLNEIATLRRAGVIDGDVAARLRDYHLAASPAAETAAAAPTVPVAPSTPRPAPPVAPIAPERTPPPAMPPTPRPVVPAGPGLFSPERAPSLLLYIGAFLIVVSALIFVNVSGKQVSAALKLVLLVLGTISFLGVGLFCHRYPRVVEAGRTFVGIGALLVPLDFAAYYILITGVAVAPSVIWTLGSLVSAGLYGLLAMSGFGRFYAYLFLPAALSTVVGIEWVLAVPGEWLTLPLALVPMALALLRSRVHDERVERLAGPLDRPGQILAGIALLFSATLVPLSESVSGAPSSSERRVVLATFVVGAVYYGIRARGGSVFERWLAVLGPGAIAVAIAYTLRVPLQTYGFTFALVALGYGIAADVWRVGAPVPLPAWIADFSQRVALATAITALLPWDAYWRAPFVGATVDLAIGAGLAAACVRRAGERIALLPALLATSAVAIHVGVVLLLIALGLLHARLAPAYSGLIGRELALAFAPLAALLGGAAWIARSRLRPLARETAVIALASAAATLLSAYEDPPLATILAAIAGVALVVAARAARTPLVLWIATAAFAVAALSLDRWLRPPLETRPLALAALALLVYVPAYLRRWRDAPLSAAQRQIGLVTAAAAVIVGLGTWSTLATGRDLFSLPLWIATVPAVAVFGGIGVADGMLRRSESQILGSSVAFLAAVLMVVARFRPDPIEAYTLPAAAYLAIVAWSLAHWRAALRPTLELPSRIGAALVLVLPTYQMSWSGDDVLRGVVVLAESVVMLVFALWIADRAVALTAVVLLGLMAVRGAAAPLAFESSTAAFGVVVIALAFAASRVPRLTMDSWTREATEVAGSLLIVLPPLARTIARGPDALDHGASVLAVSVVLVAVAVWTGRRILVVTGLGAAAAVGVLALPDSARAEPYVAAAGAALLLLALSIGGVVPHRLPARLEWAIEITAAALAISGATQQTFAVGGGASIRLAVEGLGLIVAGVLVARPMIAYVGIGGAALVAWWVLGDVGAREFHGVLVGAALVALSLYAARYAPRVLDPRALLAMEGGGALLFIAPTLLAGWGEDFFPRTPMVFFEILLVLGVGVLLHRRWLVAAAIAALGLETIRGLIDAVNRLPNYVLFAASGALLLGVGFVLLLNREAWRAWSNRVIAWWARL